MLCKSKPSPPVSIKEDHQADLVYMWKGRRMILTGARKALIIDYLSSSLDFPGGYCLKREDILSL